MHFRRREILKGMGAAGLTPLLLSGCASSGGGSPPLPELPDYEWNGPLGPDNLFEHGIGGDPEQVDAVSVLDLGVEGQLRLLLPDAPPDDVLYQIERCTDLGDPWVVVASKIGPGEWSGDGPVGSFAADPGRVWVEFEAESVPQVFYRLAISLVAP